MTDTNRYNGWRNYATWKVYTEMLYGNDCKEFRGTSLVNFNTLPDEQKSTECALRYLAEVLEERVTDSIFVPSNLCCTGPGMPLSEQLGHVQEFALAFLEDVDWLEIADQVIDDIQPPGTFTNYAKASRAHAESGGYLLVIGDAPLCYAVTDEPETWGRTPEQIKWLDTHPESMWDETRVSWEYPGVD